MENTGYTSIADIGRLGRIPVNKILVKYWYYQYCSTSIAAGCFIRPVFAVKDAHFKY
jgi:hypothetical protein